MGEEDPEEGRYIHCPFCSQFKMLEEWGKDRVPKGIGSNEAESLYGSENVFLTVQWDDCQ
jgi:hypothetical protein